MNPLGAVSFRSVRSLATAWLLSVVLVGCTSANSATSTTATSTTSTSSTVATGSSEPLRVVLDYSPTLSDAGALLYLASNPAVELLAVTLPGTGEADCVPGVRTTRSLLTIAGRPDVPIGCGVDTPLVGNRDWPQEWRDEVNRWSNELLPPGDDESVRDAGELLVATLSGASTPITLVAVAPLTNLGIVLEAHPELAEHVERVVIMGGAVNVAGNVEASPDAEWNIYIDPEAARRVIASGIPITMVPLDATNHVPWTDVLVRRLGTIERSVGQTEHRLVTSRATLDGFYLWDELAAMATVRPDLVTVQSVAVSIDDSGAVVADPAGTSIDVAVDADADAATEEFLQTLNGGPLPVAAPLTSDESDYLSSMSASNTRTSTALDVAYASVESHASDPPREAAAAFVGLFFDALSGLAVEVRALDPPATLSDAHNRYLALLEEFLTKRDAIFAALADADGADADEVMNNALAKVLPQISSGDVFGRITAACRVIEDYSILRGGPLLCAGGGG